MQSFEIPLRLSFSTTDPLSDDQRVIIPAEIRSVVIPAENRGVTIPLESRGVVVTAEDRRAK